MRFVKNRALLGIVEIVVFVGALVFTFERIDAHLTAEVFGLTRDWNQIHGDAFKESEDVASLRLLKSLVVLRVLVRIVLRGEVFASYPAFEKHIRATVSVLLVGHLLSELLEVRCDLSNFRFAFKAKFGWELGQALILTNVADTEELTVKKAVLGAVAFITTGAPSSSL